MSRRKMLKERDGYKILLVKFLLSHMGGDGGRLMGKGREKCHRPFMLFLSRLNYILIFFRFGDEGCLGLCKGLQGNKVLLSLSLCYCDLGIKSGTPLGELISSTAIR